ncbi:MAG TPA: STAS domain-containing protein [Rhodocyclaceae bacterium]|nr:STAS domain-containing protein [Rhodocyclaceae bacterium]
MGLHLEQTSTGSRLIIDGEMTVHCAWQLRDEILALLPQEGELSVELSGVSEIDSAGLQLMLQVKRSHGPALRFINHSPAVLQILDIAHLAAHFGDPMVIPSGERTFGQS